MKKTKTTIPLESWLYIVRKMLNDSAIRDGLSVPWFSVKACQGGLTDSQICELNNAVWSIARRLACIRIVYNNKRKSVPNQIYEKLGSVKHRYIYDRYLERSEHWWHRKMSNDKENLFTEDEVVTINLALSDIAMQLLGLELVADKD